MWKNLLLDVLIVVIFSLLGSLGAFLVYRYMFQVNYYVIDTGMLLSSGVPSSSIYEYMKSYPAIYIDKYCVIYAPSDRDVTRRVLDAVRKK